MIKAPSIAAGWQSYREMVLHPQAPAVQVSECRLAFFAGAAVLFESIMKCLDSGEEPTDADMARMEAIDKELRAFGEKFDAEIIARAGGKQ